MRWKIAINLLSAPEVQINYTETNGTTSSVSTTRSQSSSTNVTSSNSSSSTNGFEHSYEESLSIGNDGGLGFLGVSASFTATQTFSQETTTSWSQEQSNENSSALEQAESFETASEISAGDGQLAVVASISNFGNLSYTIDSMVLAATYFDLSLNNPLLPVGNLDFDNTQGAIPSVSLGPGQSTGPLNFIIRNINLQTVKSLLGNSNGISVSPAIFNLLDRDGNAFNLNLSSIQSQNAIVSVDFGISSGRKPINEWVAVNGDPTSKISIQSALSTVMGLNITMSGIPGVITQVDNISNAIVDMNDPSGSKGFWVMVHAVNIGNNEFTSTLYTTTEQANLLLAINPQITNLASSYDLSNIQLRGGDKLTLTFLQDSDLDGLGNRQEFFYRTDPQQADTDGDALTDGQEIAGWDVTYTAGAASITTTVSSDPLRQDTDSDSLNDFLEANLASANPMLSRNPLTADTDGDRIPDTEDDFSDSAPITRLANEVDLTDINNLSTIYNAIPDPVTTISYTLNDVMGTGSYATAGNNVNDYRVLLLRFNNELNHPNIPLPDPGPLVNTFYAVGSRISCDQAQLGTPLTGSASTTCDWVVVDYFDPVADAIALPFTQVISDETVDEDSTNGSQNLGTGPFKYIGYIQINGRYTRSDQVAFASGESEIIQISMRGGRLINNLPQEFETCISLPVGGEFCIPVDRGDGNFDINFQLLVDDHFLEDGRDPFNAIDLTRSVAFSNVSQADISTTASGFGWDIFADTDPALLNPAVDVSGGLECPAISNGGDIYSGGGWNCLDSSVQIQPSTGNVQLAVPVYEFRVPAAAGCHKIKLRVRELDINFDGNNLQRWQRPSFPTLDANPEEDKNYATDTAKLCRDDAAPGLGNWSIESRLPNTDPIATANGIIGSAPSPTSGIISSTGFAGNTTTQTSNFNPIQYQTRALLWNYFTPNQSIDNQLINSVSGGLTPALINTQWGDVRVRYDVLVIPAP